MASEFVAVAVPWIGGFDHGLDVWRALLAGLAGGHPRGQRESGPQMGAPHGARKRPHHCPAPACPPGPNPTPSRAASHRSEEEPLLCADQLRESGLGWATCLGWPRMGDIRALRG